MFLRSARTRWPSVRFFVERPAGPRSDSDQRSPKRDPFERLDGCDVGVVRQPLRAARLGAEDATGRRFARSCRPASVLVARGLCASGAGRRRCRSVGLPARESLGATCCRHDAADGARAGTDGRRGATDEPHLLRRADLSEHRTEPGGPQRRAQMCNDGAVVDGRLQCASGEYNKQPYAYPHALEPRLSHLRRRADGGVRRERHRDGLSVCFVYLLVLVAVCDRVAAFFAALLFALTPEQIVWSATAAVEPSPRWRAWLRCLATACFIRSRSTTALAGTASRRPMPSSSDRSRS